MSFREKYTLEIGYIQQDINSVKNTPSCSTIGQRLDRAFNELIDKIEKNAPGSGDILTEQLKNIT